METTCGEEELCLAKKLRESCNRKGSELQPAVTAKLLHKLGRLYGKKCDKFSLIQSVALLTSAILRKPENVAQIKQDLDDTCAKVLRLCPSRINPSFLDRAVDDIKARVAQFREETKTALRRLQKIPDDIWNEELNQSRKIKVIKTAAIQDQVTETYTDIMRRISDYCLQAFDEPPCQFTLVGLGSLARRDITPFSDFEHAIVLPDEVQTLGNYPDILNYFRWFAVLFQVILVRLGETLLSFLAIPSLNNPFEAEHCWFFDDITPCGISPDGMGPNASKTPLGCPPMYKSGKSSELIKPCGEMVAYLLKTEDPQIQLIKTCFVFGDKPLFQKFGKQLNSNPAPFTKDMFNNLVDKCFDKFDFSKVFRMLGSNERFDVKRVLFRSITMYVAALGSFFNIHEASCLDIIDRLYALGIMDEEFRKQLRFCVAVSYEIRLHFYTAKQAQDDILMQAQFYQEERHLKDIVDTVGATTLADAVVSIYAFQMNVSKMVEARSNGIKAICCWAEKGRLLEVLYVCNRLKLYGTCNMLINKHPERLTITSGTDYATLLYFEVDSLKGMMKYTKAAQAAKRTLKKFANERFLPKHYSIDIHFLHGVSLNYNRRYKAALRKFRKVNYFYRTEQPHNANYISLYGQMSVCFWRLERFAKGLKYAERELSAVLEKYDEPKFVTEYYDALHSKGICLRGLGRLDKGQATLRSAIELRRTFLPNKCDDIHVKQCLLELGACQYDLGLCKEALSSIEEACVPSPDETHKFKLDLHGYLVIKGDCLNLLGRHNEAMVAYQKAIDSFSHLNLCVKSLAHQKLAWCWHQMAQCAADAGDHKKAMEYFKEVKSMYEAYGRETVGMLSKGQLSYTLGLLYCKGGNYDEALLVWLKNECRCWVYSSTNQNDVRIEYHAMVAKCFKANGDLKSATEHSEKARDFSNQIDWKQMGKLQSSNAFKLKLGFDFTQIRKTYGQADYMRVVSKVKQFLSVVSILRETQSQVEKRTAAVIYMATSLTQLQRYSESIQASESTLVLALQIWDPQHGEGIEKIIQLVDNIRRCKINLGQAFPLAPKSTPSIFWHVHTTIEDREVRACMEYTTGINEEEPVQPQEQVEYGSMLEIL